MVKARLIVTMPESLALKIGRQLSGGKHLQVSEMTILSIYTQPSVKVQAPMLKTTVRRIEFIIKNRGNKMRIPWTRLAKEYSALYPDDKVGANAVRSNWENNKHKRWQVGDLCS